jgi:hypothetical protein
MSVNSLFVKLQTWSAEPDSEYPTRISRAGPQRPAAAVAHQRSVKAPSAIVLDTRESVNSQARESVRSSL